VIKNPYVRATHVVEERDKNLLVTRHEKRGSKGIPLLFL
jgi:hypothetical protein